MDRRRWVRERQVGSLARKQFKKIVTTRKQVSRSAILTHPLTVVQDLRNGSLDSLNHYLRKNKGIPDRQVALELRKLLSGTLSRAKYRLVVVDHPSAPKGKPGRPKKKVGAPPTEGRQILASQFRDKLKQKDKPYLAAQDVGEGEGRHMTTVLRAHRDVESHKHFLERIAHEEAASSAKRAASQEKRKKALRRLADDAAAARKRTD